MLSTRALLRSGAGSLVRGTARWAARVAAVGPRDRPARRFGHFGEGSCLAWPFGSVYNERYISIGDDTLIGPLVTISAGMAPGQEMVTDPVVIIGDRCLIGRHSALVGHFRIDVGDDVFMGMGVYITDQNHGYEDPTVPIGRQMPTEAPVRIGAGSWIGSGAVVLPGSDIGRHVVVAANAVVRGAVPDYSVVAGVPARVVKRLGATGWSRVDDG